LQEPALEIPLIAAQTRPVIAARPAAATELNAVRRACEELQRELAPELNLAGYFVMCE
jgi:hypothetical protein